MFLRNGQQLSQEKQSSGDRCWWHFIKLPGAQVTSLQRSHRGGCSAKAEGVRSPRCQTPVGTERWQLLRVGRRKADGLRCALPGVWAPPPRTPGCDPCFCEHPYAEAVRCLSGHRDVLGALAGSEYEAVWLRGVNVFLF